MSHDLGHMTKATRARGERALQHVMDEIVRILQDAAAAGPGKEG
jgi:creatinine amidohydrolase/Fe(II)-dependent formamide hydrolase-like protein